MSPLSLPPCPAPEPPAGVPPPPTHYLQVPQPSRARRPQLRPPAATHRPRGAPRWRQHAARGSPARRLAASWRRLSLPPRLRSWAAPKCRGAARGSRARQAPPGERDGPFPYLHPPEPWAAYLAGRGRLAGRRPPPRLTEGASFPLPTAAAGEKPRSPRLLPPPAGERPPRGPFSGRERDPAPGAASARPLRRRRRPHAPAARVRQSRASKCRLSGFCPPVTWSLLPRDVNFYREVPKNLWERSGTFHLTSFQAD